MKAFTYFSMAVVLLFVFGLIPIANAGLMGINIIIKQDRETANQKTVMPETPERWQHLNRFYRDEVDKGGLSGGIILPSYEEQAVPKNFRNNL